MMKYTRAAFNKIVGDLRKLSYVFNFCVPTLSLSYLVYALATQTGIFAINLIALAVTVLYLIFYAVYSYKIEKQNRAGSKKTKKVRRGVKHLYKTCRLIASACSLAISVYGIYFTAQNVTPISVALVGLLMIFWILNVLIMLAYEFVYNRVELLIDGIQYDIESMNPVKAVKDAVNKMQGREIVVDTDKISRKSRNVLDALADKEEENKKEKEESGLIKRFFKSAFGDSSDNNSK